MNMLPPSDATLLLRTDFSDQKTWEALRTTIGSPNEEGFMANAEVLDNRAYQDLTTEQVLALVRKTISTGSSQWRTRPP